MQTAPLLKGHGNTLWVASYWHQMLEQLKQGVPQHRDDTTPHALGSLYHQMRQRIRLLRRMHRYLSKYQSLI